MKKGNITTKIIAAALVGVFMVGCNSSTYIAKRKYTDGYYIATSKSINHKAVKSETSTVLESKNVQTLDARPTSELSMNSTIIENNVTASVNDVVAKTQAAKSPFVKATTITEAPTTLTKWEKRAVIKQAVKKATVTAKKSSMADDMKILCIILCFFIPPLAVYLIQDDITKDFWVNLILTFLCFIPGLIHGLIVVSKN